MRPITTDAATATYSKDAQLQRVELDFQDNADGREAETKRRRRQSTTVDVKAHELEGLLATHWDPTGPWDSGANRLKAERLRTAVGTGYRDAARSLISQTGQYCAYCDAPMFSGLKADPMLPADWFPTIAFDYDKQLLACTSCLEAKQRKLSRTTGTAAGLSDPNTLAWPHVFAQTLTDGALLPFRYDLVRVNWALGTPTGPQLVTEQQMPELLQLYRRGYVQVNRSALFWPGRVEVQPPGAQPYGIAAWLSPTSTNRTIEAGVRAIIDLFELNAVNDSASKEGMDRRLELRTMAYFKALDLRERMNTTIARGDADLASRMVDLWKYTIQATGFWGVWLTVFRDRPDIQQRLLECMPGTFQRAWAL